MLAVFAKVTITQLNARTAFLFRSIRSFRDLLSGPAFNCLCCIFFLFVENLSTRYRLVNHFETLQSGSKRTLYKDSRQYFLHGSFTMRCNLPSILDFSWNLSLWLETLQPLVSLQRLISTSCSTFLRPTLLLNAIYFNPFKWSLLISVLSTYIEY